jgi:hypothetical protein
MAQVVEEMWRGSDVRSYENRWSAAEDIVEFCDSVTGLECYLLRGNSDPRYLYKEKDGQEAQ